MAALGFVIRSSFFLPFTSSFSFQPYRILATELNYPMGPFIECRYFLVDIHYVYGFNGMFDVDTSTFFFRFSRKLPIQNHSSMEKDEC